MKYSFLILLLFIFSGSLTIVSGQSPEWNLDFEEWDLTDGTPGLWHDRTVIENQIGLFPPKWHFRPDHIPERMGLGRTTDATEGNYAVTLSGYYGYQVMRIIAGESAVKPGWPIDFKPTKLIGDYKAILLGECDSLRTYVEVYLTKHNLSTNNRDTLGQANIVLNESTSYKEFELEIAYSDNELIPDTVIVVLSKKRFGFGSPPACLECSHVFFDNLRFSNITSTNSNKDIDKITVYPNPTQDHLFIKSTCGDCLYHITLINLTGQVVHRYHSIKDEIKLHTHDLMKGLYFIRVEDTETGIFTNEKIIIE